MKTMQNTENIKAEVKRFSPSAQWGLSEEQVRERQKQGLCNRNADVSTKSIKRIFFDNIVTIFNVLNIILGLAVLYVGSYKNMLFLGVMFFNTTIGIFQEIRAKRTIDKLSIVSATKATAVRNGKKCRLAVDEIVLDDVMVFSQGNQIPVDCKVIAGECDVNESLLTGESDAVHKRAGDMVLSGSFLISGTCYAQVEQIGSDSYAAKISAEAKYAKKVNSEIMYTLNWIIKVLTFIILPLALIMFWRQYSIPSELSGMMEPTLFGGVDAHIQRAIVNTVAAVIGIIPEGLILLTSTVLAVSVIRLSKNKVLVQELYCIETLARVYVLCLDKTGTITEGCMEVADMVVYDEAAEKEILEDIMCGLTANLDDTNATFMALKERFRTPSSMKAEKVVPFASEKKWSGAYFKGQGAYIMGAAEFILDRVPADLKTLLDGYSRNYRSIILARSEHPFQGNDLPKDISVLGIILLNDKIRPEAPRTLRYFADQKVEVKVISGDNPITVSDVARRAEVKNYDKYIDATTLKTYEDVKSAIAKYTVFGRVTPAQKKQFVVALKEQGHTVAMTGDGVNDVLALKEADCSIAMAAGSDAARSVSQLVLLDSNFASMPKVVAEGRRSINNIQRSATLFIVKTIFSIILAFLFLFIAVPYPFQPIQLTLVNAFTIGIPSFILALEPNKDRIKGIFIVNILKNAIPAGLTTVVNIIMCIIAMHVFHLDVTEYSTLCVCMTSAAAFMILFQVSVPFNAIRKILFVLMVGGMTIGVTCFRNFYGVNFFNFAFMDWKLSLLTVVMIAVSLGIFILLTKPMKRWSRRVHRRFKGKTFRPKNS